MRTNVSSWIIPWRADRDKTLMELKLKVRGDILFEELGRVETQGSERIRWERRGGARLWDKYAGRAGLGWSKIMGRIFGRVGLEPGYGTDTLEG